VRLSVHEALEVGRDAGREYTTALATLLDKGEPPETRLAGFRYLLLCADASPGMRRRLQGDRARIVGAVLDARDLHVYLATEVLSHLPGLTSSMLQAHRAALTRLRTALPPNRKAIASRWL